MSSMCVSVCGMFGRLLLLLLLLLLFAKSDFRFWNTTDFILSCFLLLPCSTMFYHEGMILGHIPLIFRHATYDYHLCPSGLVAQCS